MFRSYVLLIGAMLVILGCVLTADATADGRAIGAETSRSSTNATQLERDRVIGHVGGLRSTVLRRDRIEAKLSTWSEFERLRGRDYQVSPFDSGLPVWIVAVAGDVRPETSKNGKRYPWGVWVFDARTLEPIFMAADRSGLWPAYFDALPDLAVR